MSDAGETLSRAERFRLKEVECKRLAEAAQLSQTKLIFANLALSYGRLAMHEELVEEAIGPRAPRNRKMRVNGFAPRAPKLLRPKAKPDTASTGQRWMDRIFGTAFRRVTRSA
jgi:hypothetical protein